MEHADLPVFAPNALIEFDWAGKWLTGEEYAHMPVTTLTCTALTSTSAALGLGNTPTRYTKPLVMDSSFSSRAAQWE